MPCFLSFWQFSWTISLWYICVFIAGAIKIGGTTRRAAKMVCLDLDHYEHADAWQPPQGFEPVTQLEHARLGHITPPMLRVAQREPHLSA